MTLASDYCRCNYVDICFTPSVRVTSRHACEMRSLCAANKTDNSKQFCGWKYLTLGIVALTGRRLPSNSTHTIVQLPRGEQWNFILEWSTWKCKTHYLLRLTYSIHMFSLCNFARKVTVSIMQSVYKLGIVRP